MNKTTLATENLECEEYAINIRRTDGFKNASNILSGFIAALPLNSEQNNRLIELIMYLLHESDLDAIALGLKISHGLHNSDNR